MMDAVCGQSEWSEESYSVEELVDNFAYNRPLIARVDEGNYGVDEGGTFSQGDVVKIHGVRDVNVLEALLTVPNYESTPVHIPLDHTSRLTVLPKKPRDHVYRTVACLVEDFPHSVIVGKPFSIGNRVLKEGDVLVLGTVDRRCTQAGVKEFLTCKYNDRDIPLSMEVVGNFVVYPDQREYTISEFVGRYRLPQQVRFTCGRDELFRSFSKNLLDLVSLLPEFGGEFSIQNVASHRVLVASTMLLSVEQSSDQYANQDPYYSSYTELYKSCQIVTMPDTGDHGGLSFSIALNQGMYPQSFLNGFGVEDLVDNLIEFANKPSVITFDQLGNYVEQQPPLLPRKPKPTQSGADSSGDEAASTLPPSKHSSRRATPPKLGAFSKCTSTPEMVLLPKHKKKFLHDAKTMFSQSLDNLADKLHKKKQKSPEQPRLEISGPIMHSAPQPANVDRPSDNYENVFHSMQGRRPLGARASRAEPKVGIAHPQSYGTMIGTELNTDLAEERDNACDNDSSSGMESRARGQANQYAAPPSSLRVKLPSQSDANAKRRSPTLSARSPVSAKPRMGMKHTTDQIQRRISGDLSYGGQTEMLITFSPDSETAPEPSFAQYSSVSLSREPSIPTRRPKVCYAQPQSNESHPEKNPCVEDVTESLKNVSISTVDDIPDDLGSLNVDGIVAAMRVCGLGKVAEKFQAEVLDGSLFMQLSEEMLREHFGCSKFETLKVMKIQKGYRPKL